MICSRCSNELSIDCFHSDGRGGRRKICKTCTLSRCKSYRENNKEKIKGKDAKYRKDNLEKLRSYGRKHYTLNKDRYSEASARRRATKQKATPNWLSGNQKKEIKDLFWMAQDLRRVTGENYHVDHVVPLNNELVCGLHVPWNLQILPEDINYAKSNTFAISG